MVDLFERRVDIFGNRIEFYAPGLKRWQTSEWRPKNSRRFLPISVTGQSCALNCDHCQTKVLEGMISVRLGENLFELASRLKSEGTEGILISGGSTKSGGVPLRRHLKLVPRIKEELGLKVVAHSGVVSPSLADDLAQAGVDAVMLDIIGADETVQQVYHLPLVASDFDLSLSRLDAAGLRIIPHVVIGLHYGRIIGEYRALEMIANHRVDTVILVVLTPLIGTPMADIPPPSCDDVTKIFVAARQSMAATKVNLGCARPMGDLKMRLDEAAIDVGLNGIAYPAEGAIAYARSKGLEPELYEWCCSMSWAQAVGEKLVEVRVS
ncbi:MAG: radical SAM protein [Ferrimicrobium sp.]|uniref:Radical SAM protein n=1 Tax=Ferrimicrobium acidiphilum TaxID=121039 RepID=A0ABV3Y2L1_9ACTN